MSLQISVLPPVADAFNDKKGGHRSGSKPVSELPKIPERDRVAHRPDRRFGQLPQQATLETLDGPLPDAKFWRTSTATMRRLTGGVTPDAQAAQRLLDELHWSLTQAETQLKDAQAALLRRRVTCRGP